MYILDSNRICGCIGIIMMCIFFHTLFVMKKKIPIINIEGSILYAGSLYFKGGKIILRKYTEKGRNYFKICSLRKLLYCYIDYLITNL